MPNIEGQSVPPRASVCSKESQLSNAYDVQVPVHLSL